MKNEKKSTKQLDYKKIAIALAILVVLIVIIVLITKQSTKTNELKLNDFEKIAVYGYLENDLLDISELYKLSGKAEYNDLQVFQSKLKQALDSYFANNPSSSVPTSEVVGLVDSKYLPSNLDFHGIVVSDYRYDPENDTYVKAPGENAAISVMEAEINTIDYSNQKARVQKIERTEDNKCKVTFNIVNVMNDGRPTESMNSDNNNESTISSGEAILSIDENKNLKIDSCSINE